jgi:hypothetical protein
LLFPLSLRERAGVREDQLPAQSNTCGADYALLSKILAKKTIKI